MSGTWDQAQNALAVIDYSKILVWLATQGVTLVSGAVSAYWVHGHMDAEKRMEGMIHHWEYLLASLTPTQKAMIEQRDPGAIDDLEILLQDLKGKMAFLAVRLKAASNWQRLWPCSEISRDIKDMADAFNKANHDFLRTTSAIYKRDPVDAVLSASAATASINIQMISLSSDYSINSSSQDPPTHRTENLGGSSAVPATPPVDQLTVLPAAIPRDVLAVYRSAVATTAVLLPALFNGTRSQAHASPV